MQNFCVRIFFGITLALITLLQTGCFGQPDSLERDLELTASILSKNKQKFEGRDLNQITWRIEAARAILRTARIARTERRMNVARELESRFRDYLIPALEMFVEQDTLAGDSVVADSDDKLNQLSEEGYPAAVAILAYKKIVSGARDGQRKTNLAKFLRKMNKSTHAQNGTEPFPLPEISAREIVISSEGNSLRSLMETYPDIIRHTMTLLALAESRSVKFSPKELEAAVWKRLLLLAFDPGLENLKGLKYARFVASMPDQAISDGRVPEMKNQTREFLWISEETRRRVSFYSELSATEVCDSILSLWEGAEATVEESKNVSKGTERVLTGQADECSQLPAIVPAKFSSGETKNRDK